MGDMFGVHMTAGGARAAAWRNGRPEILADGVPALRLRNELERTAGAPATDVVLAGSAATSMRWIQSQRKTWKTAGLNLARTIRSHTAVALLFAISQRYRTEALTVVVECDGPKTRVTLLDLSEDVIEELSYYADSADDPSQAVRNAVAKGGRQMSEVRVALILDSEESAGQIRYLLSPGSRVEHYSRQAIVQGAAVYAGILSGKVDGIVMQCTDFELGLQPENGSYTPMLPAAATYPAMEQKEFQVPDGKTTLDITLMEKCGDLLELGSYRIRGIPAGTRTVTVALSLNTNGTLVPQAFLPGDSRKALPLSAVAAAPAKPAQAAPSADNGNVAAVQALLPVYDNLYLAVSQPCSDPAYKKGIEQILKNLTKQLSDLGAQPYGAVGERFDPNLHNAVIHLPDYNLGENEISRVFRRGIRVNGKILRVADVQVAN